MNNSAGNIDPNNIEKCPQCCEIAWIRYLQCSECGYDEGTPI